MVDFLCASQEFMIICFYRLLSNILLFYVSERAGQRRIWNFIYSIFFFVILDLRCDTWIKYFHFFWSKPALAIKIMEKTITAYIQIKSSHRIYWIHNLLRNTNKRHFGSYFASHLLSRPLFACLWSHIKTHQNDDKSNDRHIIWSATKFNFIALNGRFNAIKCRTHTTYESPS